MKATLLAIGFLALATTSSYAKDKDVKVNLKYYGAVISTSEVNSDCSNRAKEIKDQAISVENALGMSPNSISVNSQITLADHNGDPSYACTATIKSSDANKSIALVTVSKHVGKKLRSQCNESFKVSSSSSDVLLAYQSIYLSFSLKNTCKVYAVKAVDRQ